MSEDNDVDYAGETYTLDDDWHPRDTDDSDGGDLEDEAAKPPSRTGIIVNFTDVPATYSLLEEKRSLPLRRDESPSESEFTVKGTRDVRMEVTKGDLELRIAILKGKVGFKGSLARFLADPGRFLKASEAVRSVLDAENLAQDSTEIRNWKDIVHSGLGLSW